VYKLIIKKSARKELDNISNPFFLKIDEAILALKNNPHPYCPELDGRLVSVKGHEECKYYECDLIKKQAHLYNRQSPPHAD